MLNGNFEKIVDNLINKLPGTLKLRGFGLAKIPLLFMVSPKVISADRDGCQVKVPLGYVTKNHLNSMYFGALAIGADTVVGLLALEIIKEFPDLKMAPIFKDMKADFLKRAETDVIFQCEAAEQIRQMIRKSAELKERVTEGIHVRAVSANDPNEIFAEFQLGLSLKATQVKA